MCQVIHNTPTIWAQGFEKKVDFRFINREIDRLLFK